MTQTVILSGDYRRSQARRLIDVAPPYAVVTVKPPTRTSDQNYKMWAMLCDLGLQSLDGRAVSITSACIASGAPPTTALRWIAWLIEAGLATRAPDEFDSRRSWLAITAEGIEALERSFGAIADRRVAA